MNGAQQKSFLAYSPSFTGGVRVAVSDVNRDERLDIIIGAGPHVRVLSGANGGTTRRLFLPASSTGSVCSGCHCRARVNYLGAVSRGASHPVELESPRFM